MKKPLLSKLRLRRRQRGQGMTEYIIITALIAIAAIAAVSYFGQTARSQIGGMASELSGKSATTSIQNAQTASGKAVTEGTTQKGMATYNNATATGGASE